MYCWFLFEDSSCPLNNSDFTKGVCTINRMYKKKKCGFPYQIVFLCFLKIYSKQYNSLLSRLKNHKKVILKISFIKDNSIIPKLTRDNLTQCPEGAYNN